jgi:hypothetical protein
VPRLVDCPGHVRLAAGCFAALVLGFVLLAQANLWVQVGGGRPPGPHTVLVRYHGDPDRTPLDDVLDPARKLGDKRNMWQYLGTSPDDPGIPARRKTILDWVHAGAPKAGWPTVAPIFTDFQKCAQCHVPGGERRDLPFTSYEEVLKVARPGTGMALGSLLLTAHNHLFGFAVLALLLSLGLCTTRVGGWLRTALILGASGGAALDVSGWFLTRAWGSPFQMQVMLGGGLFGLATTLMALAILRDAACRGKRDGSP